MPSAIEDAQDLTVLELLQQTRSHEKVQGQRPPARMMPAYILFYLMGIGLAVAYSCVLFQSVFFAECLGYNPKTFITNVFAAFNIPSLPVYYFQLKYDRKFDVQHGTRVTVPFRMVVSHLLMLVPVVTMPFITPANVPLLMLTMFLAGAGNGAAFGTLTSLASSFTPKCVAFLLMGTGSTSFVLLAMSQSLGMLCDADENIHNTKRSIFYFTCAAFIVVNILLITILFNIDVGRFYVTKRDISIGFNTDFVISKDDTIVESSVSRSQPLLDADMLESSDSEHSLMSVKTDDDDQDPERDLLSKAHTKPLGEVFRTAWLPMATAFMVYFPQYIAYPLYMMFAGQPQAYLMNAFYIDAIANFIGRQLTLFRQFSILQSHSAVLAIASIRSIIFTTFFFVIASKHTVVDTGFFMFMFATWGITNGYLGTLPYSFATSYFKSSDDKGNATLLLNIVSTICTYLSALFSFLITPLIWT